MFCFGLLRCFWVSCMFSSVARLLTAGHSKVYDSRLDPSQIDYRSGTSKLDVHQRNTYNRTNHNRYQTEQYRQSSSSSSSSHHLLPQVVVHRSDSSSSAAAAPLPYATGSTAAGSAAVSAAAAADNNNHSQYSALHNLHNQISRYAQEQPDPYWDDTADSRRFTERRKKTVRFDGQDSDDWTRWDAERQGSQDSATKDSGIDTSSTFTSSEDSNRGDGPKVFSSFFHFYFLHFRFPRLQISLPLSCVSFDL